MDKSNPIQDERKILDSEKSSPTSAKFLRETDERILMQPISKPKSELQTNQQVSLSPETNKGKTR